MSLDRKQGAAVKRAAERVSQAVLSLKMAAAELEAVNLDPKSVNLACTAATNCKGSLQSMLVEDVPARKKD